LGPNFKFFGTLSHKIRQVINCELKAGELKKGCNQIIDADYKMEAM
jgi:hypothetical protein